MKPKEGTDHQAHKAYGEKIGQVQSLVGAVKGVRRFLGSVEWPWVLAIVLLAGALIDAIVPVPTSASDTTKSLRSTLLTLFTAAFAGMLVFAVQSGRSRSERRHDVLRGAYLLLIKAAARLYDLNREETMWPNGHPHPGLARGMSAGDLGEEYLRHDPFERANALAAEIRILRDDAVPAIVLEVGPDDPALRAWEEVDRAYWRCAGARTKERRDINEIQAAERSLGMTQEQLNLVCHERLASLR
jgi:hypothetical protein